MVRQVNQYSNSMLSPGYIALSREPALLCAVCGNGVVVTVWDRLRHAGGMCHCVFARRGRSDKPSNYYADIAVPQLVRGMLKQDSRPHNLEAQLFGGGNLRGFYARRAMQVVAVVKKVLKRMRVTVVSEDIGGTVGRKIVFDTRSGDVVVVKTRKVRSSDWAPDYLIGRSAE